MEPYRYALYWVPEPDSALRRFGDFWFSHPFTGRAAALFELPAELVRKAVKSPSRYGVHATLKAPFRPQTGVTEAQLQNAIEGFCQKRRTKKAGRFEFARFGDGMGEYLALVPKLPRAELEWLGAECVTHFDAFRAPLNADDILRRAVDPMTPVRAEFFETFGYPDVLSVFRFHVTLAGPISAGELDSIQAALSVPLAEIMREELEVCSISLASQRHRDGRFEPIGRYGFLR